MHNSHARHHVGLAERLAAILARRIFNVGAALDRTGIKGQVFFPPNFFIERIQDAGRFEDCTGTLIGTENP